MVVITIGLTMAKSVHLHIVIDDSTSRILGYHFQQYETTFGYLTLFISNYQQICAFQKHFTQIDEQVLSIELGAMMLVEMYNLKEFVIIWE
jgi:predicted DNA-binding protein with PD1-like motif